MSCLWFSKQHKIKIIQVKTTKKNKIHLYSYKLRNIIRKQEKKKSKIINKTQHQNFPKTFFIWN